MEVLQALRGIHAEVDVVSALSPVYLRGEPWVSSAIAVYGTAAASFEAGFAVLSGDFPAEGRLPIDSLAGVF
jgi:beta-N-acetylhexosaminidase